MKQIELQLKPDEEKFLNDFRSKGKHSAQEIRRAHILVGVHKNIKTKVLAEVLRVSGMTVWETVKAYHKGGLDYALYDIARPGAPKKYTSEHEAQISAVACSEPPQGRQRWTLGELLKSARRKKGMRRISRETIRRTLKKTLCGPGERKCGVSER